MRHFAQIRYRTATVTIKNGRPDAGMPVWKEILKEPEVEQILSFLTSIQK